MIKSRVLLRKTKHQNTLEKSLFLKTDFFNEKNYAFILSIVNDFEKSNIDFNEFQTLFIDKFQSKVEYKCINCSPLSLKFIDVNFTTFVINKSVVLEEEQSSLSFFIPLFENTKSTAEVIYFNKCKLPFPRLEIISSKEGHLLPKDTHFTKIKYGEVIIAYNQIPFVINNNDVKRYLILNVLPYESRPFIFKKEIEPSLIQSYQTTNEKFIDYDLGINFDLSLHIKKKSYPLNETNIEGVVKTMVQPSLLNRFLEKLYEKK